MRCTIAHVDMDAFFVSVELLDRPDLRGRPVAVATGTDSRSRGVVMAASYEARRHGVHSALPLAAAHRRCPELVLLSRDLARYREVSGRVMGLLGAYSDAVEIAGLDEAYVDLSASPAPKARARQLKHRVREATGLACSVGVAPNKLLAKIASDLDKPDGFAVLQPSEMLGAVGDRSARIIPGVGPRSAERLAALGIDTVSDLARADRAVLCDAFGPRMGALLRARANGRDERSLELSRARKSESRERTFAVDVTDPLELAAVLDRLARLVCESLHSHRSAGRTIAVKVRLRPFRTLTRSRTLADPTRDPETVARIGRELLGRIDCDAPVRLVGVAVGALAPDAGSSRTAPATEPVPLTLDLGPATAEGHD